MYSHATFSFYSYTYSFFRCYQAAHLKAEKIPQEECVMLTRFGNDLKELERAIKAKKQMGRMLISS